MQTATCISRARTSLSTSDAATYEIHAGDAASVSHQRVSVRLALNLMPIVGLVLFVLGALAAWQESMTIEREMQRDADLLALVIAQGIGAAHANPDEASRWLSEFERTADDIAVRIEPSTGALEASQGSVAGRSPILTPDGRVLGWVIVEESLCVRDERVRTSLLVDGVGVLVSFVIAAWAAGRIGEWLIAERIDAIRAYLRLVGRGQIPNDPLSLGLDEIGALGKEAESMAQMLARSRESEAAANAARNRSVLLLRRADRLSALGKMAAVFAHELGTPLSVVIGRSRKLTRNNDPEIAKAAGVVTEQAERMQHAVERLLAYARHEDVFELSLVDLGSVLRSSADLAEARARSKGVRISLHSERLTTDGDRRSLEQIVVNLLNNAIDASPSGGIVTVCCMKTSCHEGARRGLADEHVHIEVSDEGPGIPEEIGERAFDPFFTTKAPGEGTGLGLAIVREIAEDHGGMATIAPSSRGCRIIVHLPIGG